MKKLFTDHPHSVNETYFQHLYFASIFASKMLMGGIACLIHAIFPFIFKKTGSDLLLEMTATFVSRMPAPDQRVNAIHDIIEKKKQQNGRNH